MATAASQGSSRFAGILKKKSIRPELDADGRVKQVKRFFYVDVLYCVFITF
jgi:hypothetical protein